jgi:transcriptional regulator with XRE-family HTH domain
MKQLRVNVQIKNNLLLERRERLGLTQIELALAANVEKAHYAQYETLRRKPLEKIWVGDCEAYDWRDDALKIAEFYEVDPEELWPDAVIRIDKPIVSRRMDAEQLFMLTETGQSVALLPEGAESKVAKDELARKIRDTLKSLTPREEKVILTRFGLDGDDEKTRAEVGELFEVSKQAIFVTEFKALRKLRHPSRSKHLRPFFEGAEKASKLTPKDFGPVNDPIVAELLSELELKTGYPAWAVELVVREALYACGLMKDLDAFDYEKVRARVRVNVHGLYPSEKLLAWVWEKTRGKVTEVMHDDEDLS